MVRERVVSNDHDTVILLETLPHERCEVVELGVGAEEEEEVAQRRYPAGRAPVTVTPRSSTSKPLAGRRRLHVVSSEGSLLADGRSLARLDIGRQGAPGLECSCERHQWSHRRPIGGFYGLAGLAGPTRGALDSSQAGEARAG
jgi:hypothetical protein